MIKGIPQYKRAMGLPDWAIEDYLVSAHQKKQEAAARTIQRALRAMLRRMDAAWVVVDE